MLITRIELENIKSYRHLAIDLQRGTTAISGVNGAGKTTIVEAIGYALFDSLSYNHSQFVRENEKYGRVVIHLVGSDDRPYVVERRCGSGSYWLLNDSESNYRVEQRADVLDKLHELFGIDRERPLSKLFHDALGVPQGTFTSIFLDPPGDRKKTFDALLQIEDYRTAFEYLLEAQKQYKEQAQTQLNEIQRLTYETSDLEPWREQLKDARLLHQQQTEQIAQWTRQLEQLELRIAALTQQSDALRQLQTSFDQKQATYQSTQKLLAERQQALDDAQQAHTIIEANRDAYQRYQQTEKTLRQLRQQERQRNSLRQQLSNEQNALAAIQATIAHLQSRLEEVAVARQRIVELSPLVDEQVEMEKQRDDWMRLVTEYNGLVKEGKRLVQQHANYLQQQKDLQQLILSIEPLQPLAALLQERIEALAKLKAQASERSVKQRQGQEKQEQLQQKQRDQETYTARLRAVENTLAKIEEHRAEAEQLPGMQQQNEQYTQQFHLLQGNIEGYLRSRKLSVGGQCPFLHEPCLNIKRQGIASLEAYFDGLVKEEQQKLESIRQQQATLAAQMNGIKKYADALNKLGQYEDNRANAAENLQRLAAEITRLEREITDLNRELAALKDVQQQITRAEAAYKESLQADAQVRDLAGLRMQVKQLQEQAEQTDTLIQERRRQVKELQGCEAQLQQVEQQLQLLGDPRAQSRAQHTIIKTEPTYQQKLQDEQQKQVQIEGRTQGLEQQLAAYAGLDEQISTQENMLQHNHAGYQAYLGNEQVALLLPQRQQAHQEIAQQLEQARTQLQSAEQLYLAAKAAFNENELAEVQTEHSRLLSDSITLTTSISATQHTIHELERAIAHAEELVIQLEQAQKEKDTLDELFTMMEQFRKVIKDAAPFVLKAMLNDISAEANRIFGEIMGDRTAQLSWQNDYEIILRRQGVNRTFAQLSGGEQMSAALAVRLALLKKLSTLNIAFFDEPTQNMDELRRTNLAEQIRRVRGFDQLIVISHDDTFEQGLDSIIRLRKTDGETNFISDDEYLALEREQVGAP